MAQVFAIILLKVAQVHFSIHKLSYVADYEGRSVNSHVLVLIRESICRFEEEHGPISGEIDPGINVKPAKKN